MTMMTTSAGVGMVGAAGDGATTTTTKACYELPRRRFRTSPQLDENSVRARFEKPEFITDSRLSSRLQLR
jgi:hypothetical protein